MQTKVYSFTLKGADEGFITGRASVYGNQDLDGEVVDRGAFDNWLRNRKSAVPTLWQHDRRSPVGWCNALESKDDGLHVRAKLLTDTELGRYAYAFAKAGVSAGAKVGLSIGFTVEKGGSYVDRDGIKHFTSLNLLEFSIVTFPANPEAAVTGTKDGVGGDERVPVTVPSETWEGILAEAVRLKELILEPGSIMTAAERERQLQDKITLRCLFDVPRLAPRPYYYREVGFQCLCALHDGHSAYLLKLSLKGDSFVGLNRNLVHPLRVMVPGVPEQRAIAYVLRTVQRAKEATEKVIAAAERLKLRVMQHLFKYGAVPLGATDEVQLADTEIGTLPSHWRVATLGEFARIGNGSTPKRDRPEYWQDGVVPWLTSGKIHESMITAADEFVTPVARSECHLPIVKANSILVAITGQGKTLGNAAMVLFDTCVSQHLAYIQLEAGCVIPEFLLLFLQSRHTELHKAGQAGGSTKGALTCAFLKSYCVPVPPIPEQRSIVSVINALSAKCRAERMRERTLTSVFDSLLHSLMTRQVRVHYLELGDAVGAD